MKVSDNVPNENENVTTGDRQTDQLSDQLLELPEWQFATKISIISTFTGEKKLETKQQQLHSFPDLEVMKCISGRD